MFTILKLECKELWKTLCIWTLAVAGMGFFCVLLFSSMKGDMEGIADSFASMGAFTEAFGMDKISIGTMTGFYATEVGTIHALGGAMFAAILGTIMLSKEEDGHTAEFLFALPVSRGKVVLSKGIALFVSIFAFHAFSASCYYAGVVILGETIEFEPFLLFHTMQFLMTLEIGAICFCISAFMKRNKLGIGLGIVLCLYAYDMIARIVPDLKDYVWVSPFSYANAADIFSETDIEKVGLIFGMVVFALTLTTAFYVYGKRDLKS